MSRKRRRSSSSGGGLFNKSPFIIKRYQLVRTEKKNVLCACEKAIIIILFIFS